MATDARGKSITAGTPVPSVKKAKLFRNGRSQAVRLPKEFRFDGTEVAIRRNDVTGDVVLSPLQGERKRSLQDWFAFFDSLEIPPDSFERKTQMPVERDIFR
jgi:antitoxin VapB